MLWIFIIPVVPYFFILLYIYRYLLLSGTYGSEEVSSKKLSVVVACKNEEKNIIPLLTSLCYQDFPPELFEVIIIDDNSVDKTFEAASGFRQLKGLKVIRNKGKGKKSALKIGIESACNELIICTDADCVAGKGWIRSISEIYSNTGASLIAGPVILESKPGFFYRFQELEFLSLQGITAGTITAGNPVMSNGANLSFPKEIYSRNSLNMHKEIGSGDDIFLLHSLKKDRTAKIIWSGSAESLVTTRAKDSVSSFLRQRERWLSKWNVYEDKFTIVLALVTLVANIGMISLLMAGLFNPGFFLIYGITFIIKSVPDFLILREIAARYGRIALMNWFIPCQLIYPFYILIIAGLSLRRDTRW